MTPPTLAFLAVILLAAPSKGPAPTPAKTAQENQNQAAPKSSKPGANQQTTGSASPAPAQPGAVVATGNQPDPGRIKKDHPATNWWGAAGVINTALLTLFNGALAFLAYRQWRAMDRQAKLMHRQAVVMRRQLASMKTTGDDTHDLAIAAKDQIVLLGKHVDAATKAADAAKQSSDTARHALEVLECADVLVTKIARPHFSDMTEQVRFASAIGCAITVKNHGRTRANQLVIHGQIKSSDFNDKERPTLSKFVELPMILGAGDTFEVAFPWIHGPAKDEIKKDKTRSLFVEIKIAYHDILGNSHQVLASGPYWPALDHFVVVHRSINENE